MLRTKHVNSTVNLPSDLQQLDEYLPSYLIYIKQTENRCNKHFDLVPAFWALSRCKHVLYCIYLHILLYTFIYMSYIVHICLYTSIYMSYVVYICLYTSIYMSYVVYIHLYTCTCPILYISVYIHLYTCPMLYIYIYIHVLSMSYIVPSVYGKCPIYRYIRHIQDDTDMYPSVYGIYTIFNNYSTNARWI